MDLHLRGLCLLFLVNPLTGLAQEDPGAASSTETSETGLALPDQAVERAEIEPAVATTVVASDIRRSTVGGRVMDEMELGRTEITGNQELPKVLYIVPWKKADPGDLLGRPVNTLLDEVLAPIDRSEFIRQVDYYGDLHRKDEE